MPASYNVTDVGVIGASKEIVWNAFLSEFAGAKEWWMPFWESQPLGDVPSGQVGNLFKATVHPPRWWRQLLFTPKFSVLVTEVQEPNHIRVEFPEGDFSGVGTFDFEEVGNGKTQVSFNWNVKTRSPRARFVSWLVNIGAVHSMVVEGGYRGLNEWLQVNSAERAKPSVGPASLSTCAGSPVTVSERN